MISTSLDHIKKSALFPAVYSMFTRVAEFSDRGYGVVFHATDCGTCSVVVSNSYLGQGFTFYFKDQVDMMTWSAGGDVRPSRIKRSFFTSSAQDSDTTELEALELLLPKKSVVIGRFIDTE